MAEEDDVTREDIDVRADEKAADASQEASTEPHASDEVIAKVRDDAQATFKRVQLALQTGHPEQALKTIDPLLERLEEFAASGPDAEDGAFDFSGPEQAYLYLAQNPDAKAETFHSTVAPYADAYGIKSAILYRLERYDEAAEAVDKALKWDPSDAGLYLERAMAHAAAREYVYLEQDLEKAYPLITTGLDLAHYHALRAAVLMSKDSIPLAAAHFAVYHDFDPEDTYAEPERELHELSHHLGHDHSLENLTSEEAQKRLKRAGEAYGPSDLAVATLQQILKDAADQGDLDSAYMAAQHLWETTHYDGWHELLDKFDKLAQDGKRVAESVAEERSQENH